MPLTIIVSRILFVPIIKNEIIFFLYPITNAKNQKYTLIIKHIPYRPNAIVSSAHHNLQPPDNKFHPQHSRFYQKWISFRYYTYSPRIPRSIKIFIYGRVITSRLLTCKRTFASRPCCAAPASVCEMNTWFFPWLMEFEKFIIIIKRRDS